jgi:hypothetical protein
MVGPLRTREVVIISKSDIDRSIAAAGAALRPAAIRMPIAVAISSFSCLRPPRIFERDDIWRIIDDLFTQHIYRRGLFSLPYMY